MPPVFLSRFGPFRIVTLSISYICLTVVGTFCEYITVAPPIGAKVNALPEGYEKVWLDGNFYYEFDGTYYRAFVDEQSEVWYEVVSVR